MTLYYSQLVSVVKKITIKWRTRRVYQCCSRFCLAMVARAVNSEPEVHDSAWLRAIKGHFSLSSSVPGRSQVWPKCIVRRFLLFLTPASKHAQIKVISILFIGASYSPTPHGQRMTIRPRVLLSSLNAHFCSDFIAVYGIYRLNAEPSYTSRAESK